MTYREHILALAYDFGIEVKDYVLWSLSTYLKSGMPEYNPFAFFHVLELGQPTPDFWATWGALGGVEGQIPDRILELQPQRTGGHRRMIYTDGRPTIAWAEPEYTTTPAKEATEVTATTIAERILDIESRFHDELTELRSEIENREFGGPNPNDVLEQAQADHKLWENRHGPDPHWASWYAKYLLGLDVTPEGHDHAADPGAVPFQVVGYGVYEEA